ncbi:TAF8 [Lepeophtheirus salmonis]|uniref:TAF8 n=1 Tax=Lepeophtheirus salmonis TaxID=72036 RepID=A0A7R8CQT2_LEPSM|nr:TAF8 [Lepeophtheirus salmonis]CAF2861627.1 TAF8 [Lepeophtheirus salmonis]
MNGSSSGGALGYEYNANGKQLSSMPQIFRDRHFIGDWFFEGNPTCWMCCVRCFKVSSMNWGAVLVPLETLQCRSHPLPADVVVAMAEMNGLRECALRTARKTLGQTLSPSPSFTQEIGDSHSLVRTATHKQPITDYESVREKASSQKRDVERALTSDRSMAPESPDLPPYLNALLFKDKIFDENERDFLPKKRVEKHDPDDEDMIKDEDREKKPKEVLESISSFSAAMSPSKKEAKSPKDKSECETWSNPYMRL